MEKLEQSPLVLVMNESVELHHDSNHEHFEGIPTATVALLAGICSSLFGLVSFVTNSVLLFTLYKDPYNYFRARATTFFVGSLSLSDFLGGAFVQPLYATYMFCLSCGVELTKLHKISLVSSHISTKISILTVVALSVDRYLAIKLTWKYRALITVRRVIGCNILIWLFCGLFEASHSTSVSEEVLHTVDLHLQTTVPLATLCAVYAATYIEFRRYSRNVVFVQRNNGGRSRVFVRNIRLEKKIVLTVVLVIIVLFISLLPYLIATNLEEHCHEEHSSVCSDLAFVITRALSIPMLCVSCATNPFLYGWRIPQYRQALRSVCRTTCNRCRRRSRTVSNAVSIFPTALASGSLIEQNAPVGPHIQQKQEAFKITET